jgi:flagellar biosynthetic protein FliQ
MISLPMLAVGLIVGVIVSILQTVTSIQDHILSFIPRAAAIFVVFALTFPWMLRIVTSFAAEVIRRLPDLVR